MDSSLPENLIALRDNAVQELTEAHDWANQLRAIINEPFGTDRSVEADYLITKILGSFTETISMLNSGKVTDPVPAKPAGVPMNSASREFRVSEERMKSSSALKNRMVFKERKTAIPRTRITPNLLDDGHSWRKFGQKVILGSKHPRNYYRCAFRNDQGCQAKKQTQVTDDDPSMSETKYLGEHTCKNQLAAPPQIILDSTTPMEPINFNHFFSFGSSNSPNDELDCQSYSTSTTIHHPPVIISSYRT
ncbi:WRKY DNA-binding transcription factor 70-like [Rhododendron vialii]|uniref:WRKY DNA-binding transcription factor 70-like n=1 Tax=Rhododendron vialii TaxID=182163 RepID=UPI00265F00B8|nr:WRKY DNA-binding transcription factor 70-like [Rhododendron vialii]